MQVHILVPGTGQDDPVTIKDVSCTDTTTVRDALKAAELKGYVFVQESRAGKACWLCLFPEAAESQSHTPCPAGATIDILKVMAGIATYALDSLVMPRRRRWNYKEVCLTGDVPEMTRSIERRPHCPGCSHSQE